MGVNSTSRGKERWGDGDSRLASKRGCWVVHVKPRECALHVLLTMSAPGPEYSFARRVV